MLLKIVLFGVVAYFIIKKISTLVAIVLGQRPQASSRTPPPRRKGEIKIDYAPDKNKKSPGKDFKGGEYIDYEEIE